MVSFFITRRLAGQADSSAFTEALIEQLTALDRRTRPHIGSPADRDGQRRRLLKKAAAQAAAAGRRLLLLVDGLDEDEGVPPAARPASPRCFPAGPSRGCGCWSPAAHTPGSPRRCPGPSAAPVPPRSPAARFRPRELAPSELGEQLKVLAKTELTKHLRGPDQLAKDIIGYIAAAGGGLTVERAR